MGIGLIANYTSTAVDPRRFAADAERAGFAGVACSDHLFRTSTYPHLWVTLASMAAATEKVMLASSFANNLMRSPVEFAQASLTLQWLSGGRFEAGLGAGWLEPEVRSIGLEFPPPPARARRYREAVLIARELLRTGSCTFHGEYYRVDVPMLGPSAPTPPPLVASVGGAWTIANVSPLVDRVELKYGSSTRGGNLDLDRLRAARLDDLHEMVAGVRAVAPKIPIGVFVMIAVGARAELAPVRERFGGSPYQGFVGDADTVLENLRALARFGVDRVQVSELLKGSIARLGDVR